MAIFRKPQSVALAVAMTGIKMGDRLLQVGCADRALLVDLASKVGLSGTAVAVVSDETEAARASEIAADAGLLIDVTRAPGSFPFAAASFDLAVVDNTAGLLSNSRPEARVGSLREVLRVLRPGGRCIVVDAAPRGGIIGALARQRADATFASSGGTETAIKAEGFVGVRVLAEREGRRFVEGTKRRV